MDQRPNLSDASTIPPLPPSISCSCGKKLLVKPELAGKKIKCPGCQKVLMVPGAEATQSLKDSLSGHDASQATLGGVKPEHKHLCDFLAPPEAPDEIGRLGGYRVLQILGHGGMGVVFKAEDPQLERMVALKAMLPSLAATDSSKQRFFREAKAAAALKHPHIVTIFQVGEDRGAPFLAMEFLEGEPLDQRLKREPRVPIPEVLRIGREVALGLAAAHAKGLIHRDIKPANVWLESSPESRVQSREPEERRVPRAESGEPKTTGNPALASPLSALDYCAKILDFGLARALGDQTQLTQSGAIIGTPAYMAPEQAGGKKVDHRCDLFSLGCTLYRMATGEMPFKGEDTISLLSALALETPIEPAALNSDIPAELNDLIMKLLAKKPVDRPASAHEVVNALRGMEHEPKTRRAEPRKRSDQPGRDPVLATRSSKPLVMALVGGLLAAVIAAIVLFWQTPHSTVRIEINDPDIQVAFDKDGPTFKGVDKHEIKITAGEHGLHIKRGDLEDQKQFPVEQVSWEDAQLFIERLNKEVKEADWVYRLPKEVEWEYACRGGPLGDKSDSAFDYYLEKPTKVLLPEQANFENGKGLKRTCKVGSYQPNRLGLYDMHGNVWEWCEVDLPQPKGASLLVPLALASATGSLPSESPRTKHIPRSSPTDVITKSARLLAACPAFSFAQAEPDVDGSPMARVKAR